MLTIKYTDLDGHEHIEEACNIRANKQTDERFPTCVSWVNCHSTLCTVDHEATIYVLSDSGAEIAKYVILGGDKNPSVAA